MRRSATRITRGIWIVRPGDLRAAWAQPRRSYAATLADGIKGLRFGIVANYTFKDVDEPVGKSVRDASQTLARLGGEIKEIRIEPLQGRLDYAKLFSEILLYEFNQILGDQYRSTPNAAELFGPIVTNNSDVGSKVTKEQYEGRFRERPAIIAEVKQAVR